jgi:hypothetical protein
MAALNGATQAAVESLQTQLLEVKLEYKEYHRTTDLQMQVLLRNQNLILQVLNSLPNRLATTIGTTLGGNGGFNGGPQPPHQEAAAPPPPPQAQQPTDDPAADEEEGKDEEDGAPPVGEDDEDDEEAAPQQALDAAAAPVAPPADPAEPIARSNRQGQQSQALRQALADNALEVINAQPVQPACDQKRPVGYRVCLNEWKANDYDYYRHLDDAVKKRWRFKTRFQSRVSVMEEIERLQRVQDEVRDPTLPSCTLEEAADLLDSMLGISPLCFTKHLAERRRENPDVDRRYRAPRRRANPPPAPRDFFEPAQANGAQDGAQDGAQRRQGGRTTQQQPLAPIDEDGSRFAEAFAGVGPPVLTQRQQEREDLTLNELAQEAAQIREEQERVRTHGPLQYRRRAFLDRRNFNGVDRYGRDEYARRHLGP